MHARWTVEGYRSVTTVLSQHGAAKTLSLSDNGTVAAWRREDDIFLTTDQVPERRLGIGRDPAISTTADHNDIVWTSPAGIVLVRASAPPVPVAQGRFPAVLTLREKSIVAWEDQGTVVVRAIPR
jgi:hypothetical protein